MKSANLVSIYPMNEQLRIQLQELEAALAALNMEETDPGRLRQRSLELIGAAIGILHQQVSDYQFPTLEQEVEFFKTIKPQFAALWNYYTRLDLIELKKPATMKPLRRFLQQELLLLQVFFDHHLEFYQYYRSGGTTLDAQLFVRGAALPPGFSSSRIDADSRFSTPGDYVLGRLLANERLRAHLTDLLQQLDSGQNLAQPRRQLHWTGNKINFIELAYALYKSGEINQGKADLAGILEGLRSLFNIKLEVMHAYRYFEDIRMRKMYSRTRFLESLRDQLQRHMEDLDGK